MNATYSPEDNKLRLYPGSRLDKETYARVRGAGFIWAPKQELFVAPMWTPNREDLLIELCGEVGDEDTGLVERAEQRAERFEDYSDKRGTEAAAAHKAVEAICDHIPLGQPILVGHHSEAHARRDAERIETGMRKAIKAWDTSKYWTDRAAGAVRHAKHKERPDVRARRIKTLEASQRKQQRNKAEAESGFRFWQGKLVLSNRTTGEKTPLLMTEENKALICRVIGNSSNYSFPVVKKEGSQPWWDGWSAWNVLQPDGERYQACPACTVAQCVARAFEHYPPLIAHYDRWINHYECRLAYERAMLQADGGTVADKTGPEVGGGVRCWCAPSGGWAYIQKVNRVSVTVLDNWGNGGGNFTRTIPFDKLVRVMTKAEVEAARAAGNLKETDDKTGFYLLSDYKPAIPKPTVEAKPEAAKIEAMRDTLATGVQVVTADQLFPTPTALARRVVELAELTAGDKVLEPSAGTGQLVKEAISAGIFRSDITAVEINGKLAGMLATWAGRVIHGDFLARNGDLGLFDKVIMNPPFSNGQENHLWPADVAHITHAKNFLMPGGRMVAICANGPRQREKLQPWATQWIDLEPGSFKESGTNVNAAIFIYDKPA